MNSTALSQWRTSFAAVLFETDKSQLKSRITDASRAIDKRLQSLGAVEGIERISLQAAQRSLAALARGPGTSFAQESRLEKSISKARSDSSELEVNRAQYGIGSQVRIRLPSGAVTTAEIVVIFTASCRKNILVSFDKRFMRIGPEQILKCVEAKA